MNTLILGIIIFLARVLDVSVGTVRTIATVQGRTQVAFLLGLVEVTAWLYVVSAIVNKVMEQPLLIVFYALGFSTGNVIGVWLERRIALGQVILRLITPHNGRVMARAIRGLGFRVTMFRGEGASGPVTELYVVCARRQVREVIRKAEEIEPEVFFITETPGDVRRFREAPGFFPKGWREETKRK